MTDISFLSNGLIPFTSFCPASISTYIINDIVDAPNHAEHPTKKNRPIAAGEVSPFTATVAALVLVIGAFFLATLVSGTFLWVLVGYVALSVAYTAKLKDFAIVDLFCIAVFFLLHLEAGGQAFGVVISDWLFLSVSFLALFLSTGKHLCEKKHLGTSAGNHRMA